MDTEAANLRPIPGSDTVWLHEPTQRALVFGLNWFALVGSQILPMARARARKLRATHFITGGLRATSGGCARIERKTRKREMYSAAQAWAHLHPDGATGCVIALPDGRYWMVAAQDGAVMARGDGIHATREAAEQALAALRAQRPALQALDAPHAAQTLARLVSALDATSRLREVASWWEGLPAPLRWSILGLVLAALLPQAWQTARQHWRSKPQAPSADAWQTAINTWRAGVPVHTLGDLRRLMESLYRAPLTLQGWGLQRIGCASSGRDWSCAAWYGRALVQASYSELLSAAPAGWRVELESLDSGVLRWQVQSEGATLATQAFPKHSDQTFIDSLQHASPAFAALQLSAARTLSMPAVRDANGMLLAAPASTPGTGGLQSRSLSLTGPLRSFGVLALRDAVANWSSFTLHVEPNKPPSLAESVLHAQLQGTLYEMD